MEITTSEEIIVSPQESADEVREEIRKVPPSRLRQALRRLAAVGERLSVQSSVSGSDVAGSGLAGMYGAKSHALTEEHEQVRPDKR